MGFISCHIYWKTYTITKVLVTTRELKLIKKEEYVAIVFDLEYGAFIVYVASMSQDWDIYLYYTVQIASIKANETFISVFLNTLTLQISSPKIELLSCESIPELMTMLST